MIARAIPLFVAGFVLVGCPKSEPDKTQPSATVEAPKPDAAPLITTPVVDAAKPPAEFKVTATASTMVFDVTRFYVTTGQQVHVVFENKGPGALPHNWVLVKPGKEASYAAFVVDKADAGYYLDSPDVLAHVDLTAPGSKSETTFTAPTEPGDYPYICSFPGHYMMMKGTLVVKAP
jgi:azurin